jgi:hypothetical protein
MANLSYWSTTILIYSINDVITQTLQMGEVYNFFFLPPITLTGYIKSCDITHLKTLRNTNHHPYAFWLAKSSCSYLPITLCEPQRIYCSRHTLWYLQYSLMFRLITNHTVVGKPESSTSLIPKPATRHNPALVPFTSNLTTCFPKIHLNANLSSHIWCSNYLYPMTRQIIVHKISIKPIIIKMRLNIGRLI